MAETTTGPARVLILGGTAEAVALAERIGPGCTVTYSLAGRTKTPSLPENVETRTGGFGGAEALRDWIAENRIAAVIDATHPYAAAIAANAASACDAAGIPRLKMLRPAWTARDGDDWRDAADVAAAAQMLPETGRRAFLSIGRQELGAFAGIGGVSFLIRTVDPLDEVPLPDATAVTGRGPFTEETETALLREHRIDVVVSKNAGGEATYAKIAAARALAVPVIMIARPAPPPGDTAARIDDALDWLAATAS